MIAVCVFITRRHCRALKELGKCKEDINNLQFLAAGTFGKYEIEEEIGIYSVIYRVKGVDRVAYIKHYCSDDPEFNRMQAEELLEKLNE